MSDQLLRLIERTDDIINFYVKCPDGKRGRPMGVARAVEMNKIDPGSVCSKETPNGRTVFYGTGNKAAGKQASKNVAGRLKESYKARGIGKEEMAADRKANRASNREAERDYKERQNTPDVVKEREVKRAKAILAKHGVSMESPGHQEELGKYKSQLMDAQKNIEALTKQLKEISGKLAGPSAGKATEATPQPSAGKPSPAEKPARTAAAESKPRKTSKLKPEEFQYVANQITEYSKNPTREGMEKAMDHLKWFSTQDLQDLAKELKLNIGGISGKERLKEVIIEDTIGFRLNAKGISDEIKEEYNHRKYDDWKDDWKGDA